MKTRLPKTIQKINKDHNDTCWAIDQWLIDVCGVSKPRRQSKGSYHIIGSPRTIDICLKQTDCDHGIRVHRNSYVDCRLYDVVTKYRVLAMFKPDMLRKICTLVREFPHISAKQGLPGLKNVRLARNRGIGLDNVVFSSGKITEYNHITLQLEFNIYHVWK